MRIGLIDVDSKGFPNLALMKLSAYHKSIGDDVEWHIAVEPHYDIVYMSKVFTDLYTPDIFEPANADKIIKGGTGYGLDNKLPDEIEHMYPDYSLYPELTKDTAYGFLTRGCPRQCGFCIVSEKEGCKSHKVADLSEFWRGQKKIMLLDPNLLACADHMDLLTQLADSRAWVDFTQGLDIRFANEENISILNRIRTKMLHFAWDNPKHDLSEHFRRFNALTNVKDERKKRVYVLTNYNSTHDEDLYRVHTLRELGFDPYVMIYEKPTAPKETKKLQRWCNAKWIYRSCEFSQYTG